MNHFYVAAGILSNPAGEVLVSERLCDGPFNGLWEFPGGKIDPDEAPTEALRRELAEELGIHVVASEHFMALRHEYPDRIVELEFFLVAAWDGEPAGLEGQRIRWIDVRELAAEELLPADAPVIEALRRRRAPAT